MEEVMSNGRDGRLHVRLDAQLRERLSARQARLYERLCARLDDRLYRRLRARLYDRLYGRLEARLHWQLRKGWEKL